LLQHLTGYTASQYCYEKEFLGFPSSEHRFEEASEIHQNLSDFLGAKKGFFDYYAPIAKSAQSLN